MTDHFAPRDPEAEERERDIQRDTHIAARTANPGAIDPAPHPARRVRHSGPDTEFCVLCLSGEHERVDDDGRRAVADCTRFDCTDYDPCPACLAEARSAGLLPVGEAATVGPRCGNNPNVRLTPGDRQAVDEFKAYLARRKAGGPPERDPFETEV